MVVFPSNREPQRHRERRGCTEKKFSKRLWETRLHSFRGEAQRNPRKAVIEKPDGILGTSSLGFDAPTHNESVVAVEQALQAAKEQNGPKAPAYLKQSGKWVFNVATDIGVKVAAVAIKQALG